MAKPQANMTDVDAASDEALVLYVLTEATQNDQQEKIKQEAREAAQNNCAQLTQIRQEIVSIDGELARISDLERRATKSQCERGRASRKNGLETYKRHEQRQRMLMQRRRQLKLELQKYAIQQDQPAPRSDMRPTASE